VYPDLGTGPPPPDTPPPNFSDPRWGYAPYNLFQWSLTQEHSVIDGHLAKFQGIFVGDAAGVNARLAARSGNRIRHQSCNSHARREFVKAQANDTILAAEMFSFFRQLYAVEYRGASLTVADRLALRQREAIPIWTRMESWLERRDVKNVLPKSDIAKAIGYLRNQWTALRQYLTHGEIPFDNNHSERVIRPLTIGRKNWMFLGSTLAAPGRMKLFSVVSSAPRHCLSIQHYLEDILLRLSQAAQHRREELTIGSLGECGWFSWAIGEHRRANHSAVSGVQHGYFMSKQYQSEQSPDSNPYHSPTSNDRTKPQDGPPRGPPAGGLIERFFETTRARREAKSRRRDGTIQGVVLEEIVNRDVVLREVSNRVDNNVLRPNNKDRSMG
jgi:hypothetical protein